MYGSYSPRFENNGSQFRLPSPFSSDNHCWRFPPQNVQRNDDPLNSPNPGMMYGYHQNYNGWMNGNGPGNINRRGGFIRKEAKRGFKPRGGFNRGNRNIQRGNAGGGSHYCDSCDRGFSTHEELQYHCSNDHVVCGLEGCTLSAHPKIVEKHQKIQHATGLFPRLSQASQNPEDIAKWIAERKKNYPTKENVERRKEEDEDRKKRGECLEVENERFGRFGRSRGGHRRGGGRGQGRGFGRGRGWGDRGRGWGDRGRGRGDVGHGRGGDAGHGQSGERGHGRGGDAGRGQSDDMGHGRGEENHGQEAEGHAQVDVGHGRGVGDHRHGDGTSGHGEQLESIQCRGRGKSGHASGGDRSNWRGRNLRNRRNCRRRQTSMPCLEKVEVPDEEEETTCIPMFKGTAALLGLAIDKPESSEEEVEDNESFSDSEWFMDEGQGGKDGKREEPSRNGNGQSVSLTSNDGITLNNALGLLMGTYGTDDSNSDEESKPTMPKRICRRREKPAPILEVVPKVIPDSPAVESSSKEVVLTAEEPPNETKAKEDEESDGSAPEEVCITKENERGENSGLSKGEEEAGGKVAEEMLPSREGDCGKKRCRRVRGKRGRWKENKGNDETSAGGEKVERHVRQEKPPTYQKRPRHPTLLEELLKNEIRHERNIILQCIRYIVDNNFFDQPYTVSSVVVKDQSEALSNDGEIETVNDCKEIRDAPNNVDIVLNPCLPHINEGGSQVDKPLQKEGECSKKVEPISCAVSAEACDISSEATSEMEIESSAEADSGSCVISAEENIIKLNESLRNDTASNSKVVSKSLTTIGEKNDFPPDVIPQKETGCNVDAALKPSLALRGENGINPDVILGKDNENPLNLKSCVEQTPEIDMCVNVPCNTEIGAEVLQNSATLNIEKNVKAIPNSNVQSIKDGNEL